METSKINDLMTEVRGLVNDSRKQNTLLENKNDWFQLCSSMDVIGDTTLAVDAYLKNITESKTDGELYIVIYGILQVLFVQQDALGNLSESLHIKFVKDSLLKDIREIRNDSIGHPTKRGHKNFSFHFISRLSMTTTSFQLMSTTANSEHKIKDINILKLIETQQEKVSETLCNVITKLKEEEMKHRYEFKEDKLASLFKGVDYDISKIYETVWGNYPLGSSNLQVLFSVVEKFKVKLKERQDFNSNIKENIQELDYPFSELKIYLNQPKNSKLNDKDAEIFLFFIRGKIHDLEEIAIEIDKKYETDIFEQ